MSMKKPVGLYLFRHGEAQNNIDAHLITGRGDCVPLTEKGKQQASALGSALLEAGIVPDAVFSSPAFRAKHTGDLVLQAMGIRRVIELDDRLHEQHTGDWMGQLASDIFTEEMVKTIEASGKDFRSPNGESMNDVGIRMMEWADEVATEGQIIFGFTHGGAIRCLASQVLNWTHAQTYQTKPANTSVSIFNKAADGEWHVSALAVDARELLE